MRPASSGLVTVLLLLRARRVLDRDLLALLQAAGDFDLVDARQARRHLAHVELLLPLVLLRKLRRRRVVLPCGKRPGQEARARGGLGGLGLLDVDDLGVVLLEQRLNRDGEHLLALLPDHVDVGRHPRAQLGPLPIDRDLDVEDLDLLLEACGRRDALDRPRELDLGVGVEGDLDGLLETNFADVDLVDAGLDDHRPDVRDRHEHGPAVERGDARGHGVAELDGTADDDAVHGRSHVEPLRRLGAREGDRDSALLDDAVFLEGRLVGRLRGLELGLALETLLGRQQALCEQALVSFVVGARLVQGNIGCLDAVLHLRKVPGLVDVRLDAGEHVTAMDAIPFANEEVDDLAR
jgi:hypothetical protein